MLPLVSIVLPAYNAESYILSCINSVSNQSFRDWELIVIDDGSSDNTLSLCNHFVKVDSRLKVISKQNTGVSDTRNIGIFESTGKYIMFLDSDDYWYDETFLERFVAVAEENSLDILRGEYKAVDIDGNDLFVKEIDASKRKCQNVILESAAFLDNILQREFFLPLCLIRREVIDDIRFNINRVFLEDIEFFIQLLLKPLRCFYTPVYFYAYRKHSMSASNRMNSKRLSDAFDMSRLYLDLSYKAIDPRLTYSFKTRSWDYYWMTLRTMATEKFDVKISRELCEELMLEELRSSLIPIMSEISSSNKWLHYFSPYTLIYYFRLRHFVGSLYRRIKHN